MNNETALATKESNALALAQEFGFDPKQNLEGAGKVEFPVIQIVHGTNQIFNIPGMDPKKNFEAIILHIHKANAYWKESFIETGGGTPPDCFSMNGLYPDPGVQVKECVDCVACEKNKFGSDGEGKSCKNMKVFYLLLPGSVLPYKMTVPATSLKAVDMYLSMLTGEGKPYQLVTTEFSLFQAKSKAGIAYSGLVLTKKGDITNREQAMKIRFMLDSFRKQMDSESIKAQDAVVVESKVNHG